MGYGMDSAYFDLCIVWYCVYEVMKMEFTEKELYEIEKAFDMYASQITVQHSQAINSFAKWDTEGNICQKLLKEATSCYDMARTISAKAAFMRESVKETKEVK